MSEYYARKDLIDLLGQPDIEDQVEAYARYRGRGLVHLLPATDPPPDAMPGAPKRLMWNCEGADAARNCVAGRWGYDRWIIVQSCRLHDALWQEIDGSGCKPTGSYRVRFDKLRCRKARGRSSDVIYAALVTRVDDVVQKRAKPVGLVLEGEDLREIAACEVEVSDDSRTTFEYGICALSSSAEPEMAMSALTVAADLLVDQSLSSRDDIRVGAEALAKAVPGWRNGGPNGLVLWVSNLYLGAELDHAFRRNRRAGIFAGNQPGFDGPNDYTRRSLYDFEMSLEIVENG